MPTRRRPAGLRYIAVGIERSVFHPLEMPQLIDQCFNQLLVAADAIANPFEQAFFVMVQLPYLQPFDDVNKRVSRLAANIPFIRGNLSPLSFADVPRQAYTEAVLGVYELNKVDLLKDLFLWAYERSAARYAAIRQSLGEPDPFRLLYRAELREIVADLIRTRAGRKEAAPLASPPGQPNGSIHPIARALSRSPKANSPACMKATSRAIRYDLPSSKPGAGCGKLNDLHAQDAARGTGWQGERGYPFISDSAMKGQAQIFHRWTLIVEEPLTKWLRVGPQKSASGATPQLMSGL